MTKSFFTAEQAKQAKFIPARRVRSMSITHKGARLVARDTSGWPSFGYDYQLSIEIPEWMTEDGGIEVISTDAMPKAETVWLSEEKNHGGTQGCFSLMFSAAAMSAATEIMTRVMDDWLHDHPEAAANLAEHEAMAAERIARRAARQAARHQSA